MKAVKAAIVILCITLLFVISNSIILTKTISGYEKAVKKIDTADTKSAEGELIDLYDKFKRDERYINLTVNHLDLTNIEEMFASAIGAARADDSSELEITKNRLEDALGHLGRLVGINLDSILYIRGTFY